jgi:hypothetical protein
MKRIDKLLAAMTVDEKIDGGGICRDRAGPESGAAKDSLGDVIACEAASPNCPVPWPALL